ncbi:tetratricopeptide repeat protein [Jatrophihabitans sp.]|uniref:tetratricopeptide repeat protein n=1 Tax=Jatrophihabitans sp. TaxID=1932789 RepID=UPI002BC85C85|nr:tetratricopeptide repeat protein [Jatrophihabitans sp.]
MTDRSPVRQAEALVTASPAAAMRVLASYLTSEPDDWQALCLAAQAQLGLSEPARALGYAQRASQLNPHSEWPVRLQAIAHRDLGHGFAAQQLSRHSVLINPGSWHTHLLVADTDLAAGAVTKHSMAAAEKARELAPNEPDTHIVVGQVALARGRRKRATTSLHQALRLDPENAAARHELARVRLHQGRIGAALDGFRAAGRLDPTLRTVRANLHAVLARALQLLHYLVMLGCFFSMLVPLVVAGLQVVAVLGVFGWAIKRGGRPLLRVIAEVPRTDELLLVWFAMELTAAALLVVRGVLTVDQPVGGEAGISLVGYAFVLLLGSGLVSSLRSAQGSRFDRTGR